MEALEENRRGEETSVVEKHLVAILCALLRGTRWPTGLGCVYGVGSSVRVCAQKKGSKEA